MIDLPQSWGFKKRFKKVSKKSLYCGILGLRKYQKKRVIQKYFGIETSQKMGADG